MLFSSAFFTRDSCIIGVVVDELRSMLMSDYAAGVAFFLFYSGLLIEPRNNNSEGWSLRGGVANALMALSLIPYLFSVPRLHEGSVRTALATSVVMGYAFYAARMKQRAQERAEHRARLNHGVKRG